MSFVSTLRLSALQSASLHPVDIPEKRERQRTVVARWKDGEFRSPGAGAKGESS